jgi:hypothetical protein
MCGSPPPRYLTHAGLKLLLFYLKLSLSARPLVHSPWPRSCPNSSRCPVGTKDGYTATCEPHEPKCLTNGGTNCFGWVKCTGKACPDFEGMICIYSGTWPFAFTATVLLHNQIDLHTVRGIENHTNGKAVHLRPETLSTPLPSTTACNAGPPTNHPNARHACCCRGFNKLEAVRGPHLPDFP